MGGQPPKPPKNIYGLKMENRLVQLVEIMANLPILFYYLFLLLILLILNLHKKTKRNSIRKSLVITW